MSNYEAELKRAETQAELALEKVGLLQRLKEIDAALAGGQIPEVAVKPKVATPKTAKPKTPAPPLADGEVRRRGRPKGSGKKVVEDGEKGVKSPKLPDLLKAIAQTAGKPLELKDFVALTLEGGYQSNAKDFSSMVYQALQKLTKNGVFEKDDETRAFSYVAA